MKRLVLGLIMAMLLLLGCASKRRAWYSQLEPAAYAERLAQSPDAQIADIRTPGEYRKDHLIGAQSNNLIGKDFKEKAKGFDTRRPLFIYCETMHRSPVAAKKLHRMGFKEIVDLKGGLHKWRKLEMPLDTTARQ